jgi:LPXTG-motif cell wall-anchored protein
MSGRTEYAGGMGIIITLLVIWLILSVLGFVIEGLLWLAVIGLVLLVATAAWGWVKRKART